jgi:sodium-dependent dicarboxylate transporter 2/3/5
MRIALAAGILCCLATLVLPPPGGLPGEAWIAGGLAVMMAIWWFTEAIPLAATALVPLALAPLLGVADLRTVAASYSHPLIILFLGGFILAKAIERWGLHRRLAHSLLGLAGDRPAQVLAAVMVATAFLSLWISNTAAAMVVAPIGAAIASRSAERRFATAIMLGIAFAATIGGMGSLIGTPPNAIFAAYASDTYGVDIGFAQWAALGVPVAVVLLAITWALLARVAPGTGCAALRDADGPPTGPIHAAEGRVAVVAGLTALAWITRPLAEWLVPGIVLSDAGIAMIAALALFILPAGGGGRERLLDWEAVGDLRWDVLILFGGGLALAGIIEQSGLAVWIGTQAKMLEGLPVIAFVVVVAAVIVYVGELASNTAMAAIFMPIAGASAVAFGTDPIAFLVPIAMAASVGFMLPVATPPNAIVFSHPSVTRADMLKAGAPLDVIGIGVVVAMTSLLGPLVF